MSGEEARERVQRRIAAVKALDVSAIVGARLTLAKKGHEFEAICPFHDERTPSFTVNDSKGFWHCFGCGAHGDAIRFIADHDGLGFMDALAEAERIGGIADHGRSAATQPPRTAMVQRESRKAPVDHGFIASELAGVRVWNDARPAPGTLVETYLRSRALDPHASGILGVVRFHPRCPTGLWKRWEHPEDARGHAPAMLAPICTLHGDTGARRWVQQGVHITYLAADGKGKARFAPFRRNGRDRTPPSRKIWGDLAGGCVPIPPRLWGDWQDAEWLGAAKQALPLKIAEGLESTLSFMQRPNIRRGACRGGCAVLSLNNMQGRPMMTGANADILPLWNLRADPASAVFTVRDAGSVMIGVDADMKGLKRRKVQERPRGPVAQRDLTGAERSRICAALAADHWRRAGAAPVACQRPPMGMDFNDEAQAMFVRENAA